LADRAPLPFFRAGRPRGLRPPPLMLEGVNLYSCFANDPTASVDPWGLTFWGDFGNGLNNTVTAIGQSLGQGLYDLTHAQWSQDQSTRTAALMSPPAPPANPAATPYIEGALGISAAAALTAGALGIAECLPRILRPPPPPEDYIPPPPEGPW